MKNHELSSLWVLLLLALTAIGCAPSMATKAGEFPLMYEEAPTTILILPPMNESTAADAKEYYATTIQEPLIFAGYYTLPYPITSEILQMEGLYDSELLRNMPLSKFREYFGADAVLFTTIRQWDLSYMVLASTLTISIDCQLKSTLSDQILWSYNGTVVVDLSGGHTEGGFVGLIAKAVATAISSALVDYVPFARQANAQALFSMPYGKYHPQHKKDQNTEFVDQIPEPSPGS